MMDLFSKNGQVLLESLCFTRTLFAFDFDGTLAPIVKDPDKAKISKTTLALLLKLSQRVPVAVISGRSLSDLNRKFTVSPGDLIGNHGLEGLNSKDQDKEVFEESCRAWKVILEKKIAVGDEFLSGVEIEDKAYSLAVHYRKSRSKREAKKFILDVTKDLTPAPRIILGKCVVNIVPAGGPHKGISLLELMVKTKTKSAVYIGDDDTDEDVFALPDPGLFTVRVGKKNTSQARFFIENQSEVNRLIEKILAYSAPEPSQRISERSPP